MKGIPAQKGRLDEWISYAVANSDSAPRISVTRISDGETIDLLYAGTKWRSVLKSEYRPLGITQIRTVYAGSMPRFVAFTQRQVEGVLVRASQFRLRTPSIIYETVRFHGGFSTSIYLCATEEQVAESLRRIEERRLEIENADPTVLKEYLTGLLTVAASHEITATHPIGHCQRTWSCPSEVFTLRTIESDLKYGGGLSEEREKFITALPHEVGVTLMKVRAWEDLERIRFYQETVADAPQVESIVREIAYKHECIRLERAGLPTNESGLNWFVGAINSTAVPVFIEWLHELAEGRHSMDMLHCFLAGLLTRKSKLDEMRRATLLAEMGLVPPDELKHITPATLKWTLDLFETTEDMRAFCAKYEALQ